MESKQTIVYAVVGVAVLAGALYFGMGDKGVTPSAPAESPAQTTELSKLASGETTFTSLLASGIAQQCDFTSATTNAESQGKVYVGGGKIRGDFTSVTQGTTVASHMIVRDESTYVWSDKAPFGMKMPVPKSGETTPQGMDNGADAMNQKVNVNCTGWDVDESVFTLPAEIKFKTMEEMMGGMMPQGMKMEM